jgi:hypothetical protein
VVDVVRDAFERVTHGVVGDRREVDYGIDAAKQNIWEIPDITEMLFIKVNLRECSGTGEAVREITEVESEKFRLRPF